MSQLEKTRNKTFPIFSSLNITSWHFIYDPKYAVTYLNFIHRYPSILRNIKNCNKFLHIFCHSEYLIRNVVLSNKIKLTHIQMY